MLSDVLTDAAHRIDDYLDDPEYAPIYQTWRDEIIALRDQMIALALKVGASPYPPGPVIDKPN